MLIFEESIPRRDSVMRYFDSEFKIDSVPSGRVIVQGRKISSQETSKDRYIYEELLNWGTICLSSPNILVTIKRSMKNIFL